MNRDPAVIHLRQHPLLVRLSDEEIVRALKSAGVIARPENSGTVDIQVVVADADGHAQGDLK